MYGLTYGLNGLWLGFHVHMLFGLLMFFGLVMLGVWAANNLKKAELKKFALWFLLVGLLGMLLTSSFGASNWKNWRTTMMSGDDSSIEDVMDEMMDEVFAESAQ